MSRNETQAVLDHCKFVREKLHEKLGVEDAEKDPCGLAALPLLAYLRSKGFRDCFITYGHVKVDRPKGNCLEAHYWVEWNGFVLDIVADRFNRHLRGQSFPEVLVAPYDQLGGRYKPVKKDAINLEDNPSLHYLREWLKAE